MHKKYKTRDYVVAIQYIGTDDNIEEINQLCEEFVVPSLVDEYGDGPCTDGVPVYVGDYIVFEMDGGYEVYDEHTFNEVYEEYVELEKEENG